MPKKPAENWTNEKRMKLSKWMDAENDIGDPRSVKRIN
jgi:hypothetical protein